MSDLLRLPPREPLQQTWADAANPLGLQGVEFVEYATDQPHALADVLQRMGFAPVARHRSREVMLYRQGGLNVVVNAHPDEARRAQLGAAGRPVISALALRVRDARAAFEAACEAGGWPVPPHAQVMELNIPAIHGVGGSRIYFVDRWREFSIYDVDFITLPQAVAQPPVWVPGLRFFGLVQYVGSGRSHDWIEFYRDLLGAQLIPDEQRYGIMPKGKLLAVPGDEPAQGFMLQLVEPEPFEPDGQERLQRIGLGVPDVLAAVQVLRQRGMEFVETAAAHTEPRGAITRTYLGSVVFELVHDARGQS
ncbi:MAG: 4-hydroxyphenylpyruvate dioxygenase [Tepidimonas sp.]|nr:4-hydroxyphenylpyruvate dioxygenase [Tepidimonas sp.]